ncbi:MAG: hypothetical protein ABIH90_02140 [Candidatus Aenigmatarchaeota archaeon]
MEKRVGVRGGGHSHDALTGGFEDGLGTGGFSIKNSVGYGQVVN